MAAAAVHAAVLVDDGVGVLGAVALLRAGRRLALSVDQLSVRRRGGVPGGRFERTLALEMRFFGTALHRWSRPDLLKIMKMSELAISLILKKAPGTTSFLCTSIIKLLIISLIIGM